jgi:hypothetical protein
MPRGDGTGPMGMGPMTGRGAGYCAGASMPGCGMGRGRGHGFGMGMAWRHGWAGVAYPAAAYPVPCESEIAPQNEVDILKNQAKYFGDALEGINKRISELATEKK